MTDLLVEPELEPVIERLTADVKRAAELLTDTEARYLVDTYYQMQDQRLRAGGQCRSMDASGEPHKVLVWVGKQASTLELRMASILKAFADSRRIGRWAQSIVGIGPIISAGMIANIDIEKAPTVGHIWRFAGLDPSVKWEKKSKRPWNASLKVLCWKAGESFVKVQNRDGDVYGHIYVTRKALELERNESGAFAAQAAAVLESKKIGKATEAYKSYSVGKLPPAHIHARAKRYAVKLFLSHLHHRWYEDHFHKAPPVPFPMEQLTPRHTHFIEPPPWPEE